MFDIIFNQKKALSSDDRVLLLVNNLGGMTEIEVLNIMNSIQEQIATTG